jgi:hypothetical protein
VTPPRNPKTLRISLAPKASAAAQSVGATWGVSGAAMLTDQDKDNEFPEYCAAPFFCQPHSAREPLLQRQALGQPGAFQAGYLFQIKTIDYQGLTST